MSRKKITITILSILLCALLSIQAITYVNAQENGVDTIKQSELVVDLELNSRQDTDVFQFGVENMFPGDSVRQTYKIKISCNDDITVRLRADTIGDSKKLEEVLKAKITLKETGETLYDGLIKDMPKSLDFKIETDESITKSLQYDIVTYLDTSVGNEYMGCEIGVNFEWWVEEIDNLDEPSQTGDNFNIVLYVSLMAASAIGIVVLVTIRKKEDKDEQ